MQIIIIIRYPAETKGKRRYYHDVIKLKALLFSVLS